MRLKQLRASSAVSDAPLLPESEYEVGMSSSDQSDASLSASGRKKHMPGGVASSFPYPMPTPEVATAFETVKLELRDAKSRGKELESDLDQLQIEHAKILKLHAQDREQLKAMQLRETEFESSIARLEARLATFDSTQKEQNDKKESLEQLLRDALREKQLADEKAEATQATISRQTDTISE